jgi:hypothetical protein
LLAKYAPINEKSMTETYSISETAKGVPPLKMNEASSITPIMIVPPALAAGKLGA